MPDGPPNDANELEVTTDLLWALADESNRRIIEYFIVSDTDQSSLNELAEYVADHHTGIYRNEPEEVAVHLHHRSLPQLVDQGIITYDLDQKVVRKRQDQMLPPDLREHVMSLNDDG